MKNFAYILSLFILLVTTVTFSQDSLTQQKNNWRYKGQSSNWTHFNPNNELPLYLGTRYIPQFNYEIERPHQKLIDFEVSADVYGTTGLRLFDSITTDGDINPYRIWGRYSTRQLEVRMGLQKIDFGSATLLRALRWFDQIDPRDPLQLTTGVWGLLGRYYFLNNTNVWLWGLYGNKDPKGLEVIPINTNQPEYGGRIQLPLSTGEAALSFHHRTADSRSLNGFLPVFSDISENRIALDAKFDLSIGLWFEGVWTHKNRNLEVLTNQEAINLGMDYTFGLGNGLNMVLEHLIIGSDKNPFQFQNTANISALSLRYPIGMFDNINAIVYYDWTNNTAYNFINWFRQFDNSTLFVMAYWNPKSNSIPLSGTSTNLYGGTGAQVMWVWNHSFKKKK